MVNNNQAVDLLLLIKENLAKCESRLEILHEYAVRNNLNQKKDELKAKSEESNLWDDPQNASKVLQEQASVNKFLDELREYKTSVEDMAEMLPVFESEQELLQEASDNLVQILDKIEKMYIKTLFSEKYDSSDCFLTVTAGSGGLEAQDWASMLFKMYEGFAKESDYKHEILDYSDAEVGIKSATIQLSGGPDSFPYGNLKGESGVHRLVRKSPFDANNNRHTSFASVVVAPVIDDEVTLEILESDLRIDTYRASGAGGQHVNKTDSAVRITHLPTGIVVQSQNDRSQHRNKAEAMRLLKSRLYALAEEQKRQEIEKAGPEKNSISWGNQIRSYVLDKSHIKDLRTGFESHQPSDVLAGNISDFLESYIKWSAKNKKI